MNVKVFGFSKRDLLSLPENHRLFFVNLACIRNDLRNLNMQFIAATNRISKGLKEPELSVALHQFAHTTRLISGTLHEANVLIRKGWNKSGLSNTLHCHLSDKAKDALKTLKKLEGRQSILWRIRNNFAFHYDPKILGDVISDLPMEHCDFIAGDDTGTGLNVFYTFAATFMNMALYGFASSDANSDIQEKLKLVGDEFMSAIDAFTIFSNELIVKTVYSFEVKRIVHCVDVKPPPLSTISLPTFVGPP